MFRKVIGRCRKYTQIIYVSTKYYKWKNYWYSILWCV